MRPGLLTSLAMMCLTLPFTLSALERDKDGYYLIHNADELVQYREACEKREVVNGRLAADIDLSSVCGIINGDTISWNPIYSYKCSLDGAGHTISNLYINSSKYNNVGFITGLNHVDNLTLKNAYVKTTYGEAIGFAKATKINNCHFEGIVMGGDKTYVMECDTLINSSNYGCCLGNLYVYGMVVRNHVENSYNRGKLYGTGFVAAFNGTSDCKQGNLYNAGKTDANIKSHGLLDSYDSELSSGYVLDNVSTPNDEPNDKIDCHILPYSKFKDGTVTDSLNKYVKQNSNDSCKLLSWVQGEDGFPRFEHVDLQPTNDTIVKFEGAYIGFELVKNKTVSLPKSDAPTLYEYDFGHLENDKISNDTTVYVSIISKLKQDTDKFFLINTAEDLVIYKNIVEKRRNSYNYYLSSNMKFPINGRLSADIDLSSVCGIINGDTINWEPINAPEQIFDGAGHTISNLFISSECGFKEALFSDIQSIKNLTLTNAYIKGYQNLAGFAINCRIMHDCNFEGIVIGNNEVAALTLNSENIINCSNYGLCVAKSNALGWKSYDMTNCYNRGKIISNGVSSVCKFHSEVDGNNFYNAGLLKDSINVFVGEEDTYKQNSVHNCYNLKRDGDIYKDNLIMNLDSSSFTSGTVTDTLNKYVSIKGFEYNNIESNTHKTVEIKLLSWEQDEDGFPRFKNVKLKPTPGYIVRFVGAYIANEISQDGTIELPKSTFEGLDYVMENGFDGKNIKSDTTVRVSVAINDAFALTQDTDGVYLINNKADLCYFRDAVNNGATKLNVRMTNDIDLEYELNGDNNWIPIGSYSNYFVHHEDDMVFKDTSSYEGIFDGTGHKISNLFGSTIPCYYKNAVLFLSIKNATIKNLVLKNSLLGSEKETAMIGHAENSTIVNCGTEADFVALTKTNIAAICASAWNCKIENCYNIGNITDNRREFPNYAFVRGVDNKKGNTTSVKNGYSIMSSNNTKKEFPILFCSEDIANISHCFVDTVLSPAVIVKDPVVGTSTDYIKSEAFLKEMNQWVDSMNAAQSEIVYANWEKDPNDGYPKFKKGDLSKSSDVMQPQPNSLTIYSDGKDLFIQSTQKGHITIYDVNGKSIESVIYDEGLTTVSGLQSGIYIAGGTKAIIR
ncbi:MAG: hypothetical protein E7077_07165 [Bacteroidales bacterium]|jgi:hypothetical protein|nr:hypothetical protein [Bacteroidales bacterium]